MSYSYSIPNYDMQNMYGVQNGYGPQNPYAAQEIPNQNQQMPDYYNQPGMMPVQNYQNPSRETVRRPAVTASVVGGLLGLKIGAGAGLLKRPYDKNGNLNSKFAQKVYEKYLKTCPENEKDILEQIDIIMKKIDKVGSKEELKTLLENNSAVKELVDVAGGDELLETINKGRTLRGTKKRVKRYLEEAKNLRIQGIHNRLQNMWDPNKKKFKSEDKNDALYKAFKKAKRQFKLKKAGILAAVGTVIGAVGGFCVSKLFGLRKNKKQAQYM